MIVTSAASKFDFSCNNVFEIIKLVAESIHKINSSHYAKICSTTAFFVFIVKDALEYAGILPDKKASPILIYRNFTKIREKTIKVLEHLNKLNNRMNK